MSNTLISIDPGGTTGWAQFELSDGGVVNFDEVKGKEQFFDWLTEQNPKIIVCEDFHLFPNKAQAQIWSDMETVRIIGAIEYFCRINKIEFVLQKPNVKSIAYMWAGIKVPKNHAATHKTDAYVHGVYYLQKNGLRKPQQGAGK